VSIVECEGEADQEIARASYEDQGIILGADSDFNVLSSYGYIHFNELGSLYKRASIINVHSHNDLMKQFNLTHDKLIDFAILLGTDFTDHHNPLEQYNAATIPGLTQSILDMPAKLLE
jgi:hypothetical protein